MADNPIATVYVTILPETSRVAADIKRALREVDPEAREAGRRWGKEIKDAIGPIKPEVKPETVTAKAELEKFRREEERKAIRQRIEFDEADAKGKLALLRREFDGVGGKFGSAGKLNLGLTGIGLIPAAATGLADLAGAVQQLSGAGLVVPGIFAGIASSLGTAALGAHGMSDALDAISKAADGTQASVDAANKSLDGLSANQADVVKTVSGLKGTFTDLQHIAGQNLFAGVSDGLKGLVGNLLPAATAGIDGISRSLNQNLLQAMNSLGSGSSQGILSRIFGNTATAQGELTASIDPIIHAFGTLAAAGSDSLPRLATAVGNVADRFNKFITAADGDGRLQKWISEGLDGFTNLGNIVLNLGKTFTAITQAAGGGGGLLRMLEESTSKLQLFLNSSAGQQKLITFFQEGRSELGQLKDIAVQLGPILGGVFQAGLSSANLWLPVIREILQDINSIPGGAQAVVTAFVAWKTIQGPASLLNSLTNVGNLLGGLPGKGAAAGGALSSALSFVGPIGTALALAGALKLVGNEIDRLTGTKYAGNFADDTLSLGGPLKAWWNFTQGKGDATQNAQGALKAAQDRAHAGAGQPALFGNLNGPQASPSSLFGTAATGTTTPIAVPVVPAVPVPGVSSYVAPVVTQGSGSSLPYTGTADPNAGISSTDAALLANVPSGIYTQAGRGDLTKGLADCSSAVEDLVNLMQGNSTAGANMSTGNAAEWLTAHGLIPTDQLVPGALNVGFNSEHMQATLPGGTNFNWGNQSAAAGGGVGGSGAFDPAFTQHYYLPGNPASAVAGGLTSSDLSLRNAQERVNDTQHSEEQAQARMDELNAKGTATAKQREAAEYALAKAKREHKDAIDSLTVAQEKYNKSSTKPGKGGMNADAESLGTSFLGGIAQIFGLDGSVFADPTQFGLFKMFKSAMGLKFDPSQAAPGMGQSLGSPAGVAPAGGDFIGGILSNVPQPFGQPTIGSPNSPGPGNQGGMDFRGATFGINPQQWTEQIAGLRSSKNRYDPMLQNLPTP